MVKIHLMVKPDTISNSFIQINGIGVDLEKDGDFVICAIRASKE